MNDQNSALLDIMRDIERAAKHIELEWPTVINADDAAQEIIVRLLEKKYATEVREMDPKPRKQVLHKIGQQIASEHRADFDYFSGNYRYSTGEVRAKLESGVLTDLEYEPGDDEFSMEISDDAIDIKRAFDQLDESKQEILLDRFARGVESTWRKSVTRAVDSLTQEMNRNVRRDDFEHDGPGSRTAISNHQAQEVIRRNE